MVSFMPWPLYPQGKGPWYPLDRRLGGPQSQSGCSGEEKNSQPLPGLEPSVIQPIAQCCTTELSQLRYWCRKENNIKRSLRTVNWIELAWDWIHWLVFVNTVMKLTGSKKKKS
jgi:hypothetical protein